MSTAAFWIVWKSISGARVSLVPHEEERHTCYTGLFYIDQVGLEHAFGGFKSLRADFDYAAVRELRTQIFENAEVAAAT